MQRMLVSRLTAGLLTVAVAAGASPAHAQGAPAEAFAGKQIELVVGYSVGGGYDTVGRLVARHIGKHIPGKPLVVVRNMPGAGSLVAANHLFNTSVRDGTVIGVFSRGNAMYPLLEDRPAKFEPEKFNWIGSTSKEIGLVAAWGTTPFKTVEDIRRNEILIGATGAGADSVVLPAILNATIGTRVKPVTGYPGNAEIQLAMERGEVHGTAGLSLSNIRTSKPDWLDGTKVNIILQLALEPHPTLLKGVPVAIDLATDPVGRQALELVLSRQSKAYPVVAPPGVPADRVATLRSAFMAMTRDAEYIAELTKAGFENSPLSGEDVATLIKRVYAAPPEAVARARAAVASSAKN